MIAYRLMQPEDSEPVSVMVARAFNRFVAPDFDEEGVQAILNFVGPEALLERLAQGSFGILACDDTVIVGIIEIFEHRHIRLLFVDEQYQRQGISRELLRRAVEICRERNPRIERLTVNSSPYAVEIYQRLGFELIGPEEVHHGVRATPMVLKL